MEKDAKVADNSSLPLTTPSLSWDPFHAVENRHPTGESLRRIRKDLVTLFKDPLPGIYAVPDPNYATLVHSIIVGPFGTPYEGGFFYFLLNFPDDYPQSPPKVKLMSTGGGRVRFNPNLYANGKVCLSILGTWSGPGWSQVLSLSSVLLSIQSLMNEHPFHNEPGQERADFRTVSNYDEIVRHETIRAAVIEMVDKDTDMHKSLPAELQNICKSLFPGFLDSYVLTCSNNLQRDGQSMQDPYQFMSGCFQYEVLLERLRKIETQLLDTELSDEEDT